VKTLGAYRLGQQEKIHDIILDPLDNGYTVVSEKQTAPKQAEYYVRQGATTLGPFIQYARSYTWYTRDYTQSNAWYAEGAEPRQFFIGSAKTVYGPIADPDIYALQYVRFEDRFLSYRADIGVYDKKDVSYLLRNGSWRELLEEDVSDIHIAPVTGKAAYSFRAQGENYIMVDGTVHGPFYYVDGVGWSADGERYAYAYGEAQRSGSWDDRLKRLVYGAETIDAQTAFQELAFGTKGLMFIDGNSVGVIGDDGSIQRFSSEKGRVLSYKVSKDGGTIAFSYVEPDSNRCFVSLVNPDAPVVYGPFINGTVSYDFSPNSKTFYCKGTKPDQVNQVIYLDAKEYAVHDPGNNRVTPIFTPRENHYAGLQEDKYLAFIADIEGDTYFRGNLLYTGKTSIIVAPDMEQVILPDGTLIYWTESGNRKYLHLAEERYGPFDYADDYSDGSTIRWIICYRGNIQLITLER
jgi:hypothetical protein